MPGADPGTSEVHRRAASYYTAVYTVAQFLKAAYEVLKNHQEPLSAREITSIATRQHGLRTSGRTPWQTMKSKLSTDILRRGEHSLFMRTAKGQFGLREWSGRVPEHVADRYRKALFDEDIVVFPADSLSRYVPGVGIHQNSFDRDALLLECRPMRRREAEETLSVIQLVSVFVVHYRDRYLTYKRTRRLPESRLHGCYSIPFGGHLNPNDISRLLNIFDPNLGGPLLERELGEELRLGVGDITNIAYRGLLYDDSRPISRQHLGIAYDVFLGTEKFTIGERGFLMDAKFETLEQIFARIQDFENWSQLIANIEWKARACPVRP
jgi:predicted NUDIX family phosphoesterase